MNNKMISFLKFLIFSSVFFFSNLIYSQTTSELKDKTVNSKYGKKFELKMDEEVHFKDSLTLVLKNFSHKRPFVGGPTKATAYLTVSKGNVSEEIELSVHGTEGKSTTENYDTLEWKEYTLQLKSFEYDKSIELFISKRK